MRLTRRGRFLLVAFVAAVSLLVLWYGTRSPVTASTGRADHAGLPWVTVQEGDTLWEIATAVSEGDDPGPMVRQIMNINRLPDPLIRPGSKLYLPSGGAG
ncbi:LysM peptidoglycan-binding domain-containing protein [Acrocarpospora corrugata]|uniref:LysM peptidoglycan-binding domain-containing protein n=1 Tax=Acrocarpospora corrugata TaxID=35763 RepID=UPI001478B5C5|nr:LysM peptidoglycan-binding domain-containing protein [Acrocarpospora corrugata]